MTYLFIYFIPCINTKAGSRFSHFIARKEEEEEKKKGLVISSEACLIHFLVGKVEIERRETLSCCLILCLSKTCLSTRGRETGLTGFGCLRNGSVCIIEVNVPQWKWNTRYPHL